MRLNKLTVTVLFLLAPLATLILGFSRPLVKEEWIRKGCDGSKRSKINVTRDKGNFRLPMDNRSISKKKLDSICAYYTTLLEKDSNLLHDPSLNFTIDNTIFVLHKYGRIALSNDKTTTIFSFVINKKGEPWSEDNAWYSSYCQRQGFVYFMETHTDIDNITVYSLSKSNSFFKTIDSKNIIAYSVREFYHLNCDKR